MILLAFILFSVPNHKTKKFTYLIQTNHPLDRRVSIDDCCSRK